MNEELVMAAGKMKWPRLTVCGSLAVLFYSCHASVQLLHDRPENLLWGCHVACLLVGVGALSRVRFINAIGTLILIVGVPSWAINLVAGGEFFPTSVLTHLGGLSCGLVSTATLGSKRGDWWRASLFVVLLIYACRLFTPPEANVNLAFRMWPAGLVEDGHLPVVFTIWVVFLWIAECLIRWAPGNGSGCRLTTSSSSAPTP